MQILGDFPGNGLLVGQKIGSASVFVMPAPFEATTTANKTLGDLRELRHNLAERWRRRHTCDS
jgi:hypothetical protein